MAMRLTTIGNYLVLQLFTIELLFYQQKSKKLFGNYETLTSVLGKTLHQPLKLIALHNLK